MLRGYKGLTLNSFPRELHLKEGGQAKGADFGNIQAPNKQYILYQPVTSSPLKKINSRGDGVYIKEGNGIYKHRQRTLFRQQRTIFNTRVKMYGLFANVQGGFIVVVCKGLQL